MVIIFTHFNAPTFPASCYFPQFAYRIHFFTFHCNFFFPRFLFRSQPLACRLVYMVLSPSNPSDRAADHRTQRGNPADPHPAQPAAASGSPIDLISSSSRS